MFFNSLQLIVHIPLIKSKLPANANLFLLDYLAIVRLHIGRLSAWLDKSFAVESDREDNLVIRQGDGYYNELIHACGYHVSLARNLILVLILAGIVLTIWLIVACKNCSSRLSRHQERWWNNVLIRLLYEVFFEITLCLMISFSAQDFESSKQTWN